MHAVSISLGSTSAVVAVATATSAAVTTPETTAPIRVTANSAGHRTTPVMAAFAEHDELLFGEDARALYARTPEVVIPYLFAFAAIAAHRSLYSDEDDSNKNNKSTEGKLASVVRLGIQDAAKKHYKGYSPLQQQENKSAEELGFISPHQSNDGDDEKHVFLPAEEVLVSFFNHVKKHTVDSTCGLTASVQEESQQQDEEQQQLAKILLTVVVPRYLFPAAVTVCESAVGDKTDKNLTSNTLRLKQRKHDAVSWLREAILRSHLGLVAAHVSILFADEAAVLAMDAVTCRPHETHPMANRYFLLPASAVPTTVTNRTLAEVTAAGKKDGIQLSAWPSANVLVVDWGALGVSLTRLRLEGGCLVDEKRPLFLRADYSTSSFIAEGENGQDLCIAATACGGGDAVDLALRDRLATTFAQQQRHVLGYQSLSDFPARAQRRLLLTAEEKKVALSKAAQVPVEIEALAEGVDLRDNMTFSRVRVDAALRGEWKLLGALEKVLREFIEIMQKETDNVIDAVILCGGMLQMPCVAQSLRHIFTQYATTTGNDRRCFAQNLVIMDSCSSTTVTGEGHVGTVAASHTVTNSTGIGAEEVACVGGCLHSYHLALAALQERESGRQARVAGGGGKKSKTALGLKIRERVEGARSVWQALTRGECNNNTNNKGNDDRNYDGYDEILVLQRPILLYTQSNMTALRTAVARQQDHGGPLELSASALSVLFSAHTPLPARVVVPFGSKQQQQPSALYFFTEDKDQKNSLSSNDKEVGTSLFVLPLSESGVRLPAAAVTEEESDKWKRYIVFTLQPKTDRISELSQEKKADDETTGVMDSSSSSSSSMQLVVQLVRVAAEVTDTLVISPSNVQSSVTLDI
ncbi:Heat shock protein 70 family [Trypanosoma melophagium]|uniref:Heat shock protein 70 family n=1 Tax=Trypanosoma melophagium TaxID=715481 RepID=UPI00351A3930|nr:Heat shock protein 70 family [Trypanosoma melophagium]